MENKLSLLIAGTHGGAGKTTVACAIVAGLHQRGITVQPFKIGPDYLDPDYLSRMAGRPCINLDLWMMPRSAIEASFRARAGSVGVSVIDGMMGLFDGMGTDGAGVSTAELASQLGVPVVLVVDAGGMGESAAAIVHGFAGFGGAEIAGVIFNRVAGPGHFGILKRAIEKIAEKIKVFGWLPPDADLEIPQRRLGWVSADARHADELMPRLVEMAQKTLDLDALLEAAGPLDRVTGRRAKAAKMRAKIGVARDAAFHFYYEDNLEALRAAGAELVPFSPISDATLPKGIGGLYLGGGFPENYASRLEENRSMREAVRKAIEQGMPTYAECGGLMYLTSNLVGTGVRAWEMVGALPGEVRMERSRPHLGYVTAVAERSTFLIEEGETLRGHAFQPSVWTGEGAGPALYRVTRPGQEDARREGFGSPTLHASYVHVHFAGAPEMPERFIKAAEEFAKPGKKKRA
ncbi:MAG: cobyrinate a,c-diamide synthase [Planctomycetes bacterium]|nr:cobyrinate a,c-diamide synthase [Planctomycetota bacterium]